MFKFFSPEILANFLTKDLFLEFTPGIKNRNNRLWRYIYLKEWQGKKIGGPVIVHPGASSVKLFTSVTNGKLAHPGGGGVYFLQIHCGGGDVMKRFINFVLKVGLGLDCDCLFLFFSRHPLGPLNKVYF